MEGNTIVEKPFVKKRTIFLSKELQYPVIKKKAGMKKEIHVILMFVKAITYLLSTP